MSQTDPSQAGWTVEPTHVVVDTADGAMFWKDVDGLFDEASAKAFAAERNAAMLPGRRTYRVYTLLPLLRPGLDKPYAPKEAPQ